uniref:ThuA domain-containing protein n=1 Tax=Persicitalea sp. TaxID=3100273 RepID=UPI0035935517
MKKQLFMLLFCAAATLGSSLHAQRLESFEVTDAWKAEIEKVAPAKTTFPTKKKHKILLFSLFTGFNHWVVPHTAAVIETLGAKSGAFEVVSSNDIAMFEKSTLKQFDAVVLNNNCSIGTHRDLFRDKVSEDKSLSEDKVVAKAKELEENLLNFVKKGGGLMALHGGIVMQNKSLEFSEMMGGSFNYHPTQQPLNVRLADSQNPLVEAFDGNGFTHVDEPYMFNVAYEKMNFRPLLYVNTSEIEGLKGDNPEDKKYISWIKRYGKGRVFYASPSHNAHSYTEHPALLKFLLDGMQY